MLDEAEQLRSERRLRQRRRSRELDSRRQLDGIVVRKARKRTVVPNVEHLDVAVAARERCHQLRRCLAVERAAALLEQLRLRRQSGIAVELQQLALDLRDPGRARHAVALLGEHLVVEVEVTQVVRGDRAELVEHRARLGRLLRELVSVLG